MSAPCSHCLSITTAEVNLTIAMAFALVLALLVMTHVVLGIQGYEDMSNTDWVSCVVDLVQQPQVTNLPYGVRLKKVRVLDMSSSMWPLIF